MAGMNIGKLLVGGIVAGLVINVGQMIVHLFLFADQSAAFSESMGVSAEPTGGQIAMFWIAGFIVGIMSVKIYAMSRPRFGPGPGTAIKAGVSVWILAELVPNIFLTTMGMFSWGDVMMFTVATLLLIVAGTYAGAMLYTEDDGAPAAAASAGDGGE